MVELLLSKLLGKLAKPRIGRDAPLEQGVVRRTTCVLEARVPNRTKVNHSEQANDTF